MSDVKTSEDVTKPSKVSPCENYQRHDETTDNFFDIGTTYMAMDLEEATEVLWIEINAKGTDNLVIRHHFDTIMRLNHPNILNCRTYWIEEDEDNSILYLICELVDNTLSHFIKRTKLNKKNIPTKTQIRIYKQILIGLAYLKSLNPPFCIPRLSSKSIFMTHDGSIKLSIIAPNNTIFNILTNSPTTVEEEPNLFYQSIKNVGRIMYSMTSLDTNVFDLNEIQKKLSIEPSLNDLNDLVSLILKNENVQINDLFRSRLLFTFPSLKLMSAYNIIKQKIDICNYKFDVPANNIFATYIEADKKVLYSDLPTLDLKKYLNEVKLGLHPLTNVATVNYSTKSTEMSSTSSPRAASVAIVDAIAPKRNESCDTLDSPHSIKTEDELNFDDPGQIIAIQCNVVKNPNEATLQTLHINILYSAMLCRHLETVLQIDGCRAELLADDLVDKKILQDKHKSYLVELIARSLNGEEFSLLFNYLK